MIDESSSLELLRNNAAIMGGVVGTEREFFADKDVVDPYFLDKSSLEL